jgi:glycosyltransferase involved in cell wall biosynthesis
VPVDIVAFSKDWNEDHTANHHLLRELAKTRKVLWLNSVATRVPNLSSGRDLGKIGRKIREFAHGPVHVENQLYVFSPLVLPLPHNAAAGAVNRQLLRGTIATLRWRLGMKAFDLWSFLPTVADYVGTLNERKSVYYCTDEWSLFSNMDQARMAETEQRLLRKLNCCFAVNHELAERKKLFAPNTFVSPHGVDHEKFAQALQPSLAIPDDIRNLPGPRIGFYGTVQDWLDYDLIAAAAIARPQWSFVLLGQVLTNVDKIKSLPNVHLLGRKPHDHLPAYCKGFDVGMIPYRIDDERMQFVNPVKLREYLSTGIPVVSTAVPEVVRYEHLCRISRSPSEFIAHLDAAVMDSRDLESRRRRSDAMKSETWAARAAFVEQTIERC